MALLTGRVPTGQLGWARLSSLFLSDLRPTANHKPAAQPGQLCGVPT
jgi:hypothetical protein